MLRAGLDLEEELLALVCASHSGEPIQLDGVRRILAMSELDESALQMPADWPLDTQAREEAIRNGEAKSPLAMNCSGKHAGMIRTTVLNGGDIASYRDPDHPTQLAIVRAIDDLAHEQADQSRDRRLRRPAVRDLAVRPGSGLRAASPGASEGPELRSRRRSGTIRSMSRAPAVTSWNCTAPSPV